MICQPFENLSPQNQARARALFVDAAAGDGYVYKDHNAVCKDRQGNIVCREYVGQSVASNDTELSLEAFFADFSPVKNIYAPDTSWDGCLFETYGDELRFVMQQQPACVWTLVDSEASDSPLLLSGIHTVNRMGYIITKEPVPHHQRYIVNDA